ncbi:metallophosphoesterase family protein [Paenibacillus xerothermodurans]|uniref:metallophosphoesterase family protein n=1 Tax=Paenibacillus xerothermodurans TaxID=1977292 RepID=UPI001FB3FC7E|nr:metallophosphoesterase [Paenibacillus xerothermodurans]
MAVAAARRRFSTGAVAAVIAAAIFIAGCAPPAGSQHTSRQDAASSSPGGADPQRPAPGSAHSDQLPGLGSGAPAQPTAPLDKPFRFAVMGDSRGLSNGLNDSTLRTLMQMAKKQSPAPEFVLFTGDQVMGGSDVASQLAAWRNAVDDYFPMTSVFPALGNHEHDEKIFTDAFQTLPNEQLEGYGRTAYFFDHGNARFITLNSNRKNASGKYIIRKEQLDWLEGLLKSREKTHYFVQVHVPAYPVGAHLGNSLDGDPAARDALWEVLDRYNVTAVFVGHEHNYNRRRIDANFDGSGHHFKNVIYQLTLGGAGAPLYAGSKETKQVLSGPKASYHYMIVDVAGATARFKTYDLQQNEIDSFTVRR